MRYWVSGGSGFYGSQMTRYLLSHGHTVVAFARSEHGHDRLEKACVGLPGRLVCTMGDVRDYERVLESMKGADRVIHAAAQKIVPWAERWPEEAVKTNVLGTINVSKAADTLGIFGILISTDKACLPASTYAASKYLAERSWKGPAVRFGNLWGSTGSVIYHLLEQRHRGTLKITDFRMTRYHLRCSEAVSFTLNALEKGKPGEVWIPKMPSYRLTDLCEAVDPRACLSEMGIRPGEKLAEDLVSPQESFRTELRDDCFIIGQELREKDVEWGVKSDANEEWLTVDELRREVEWLITSSTAQEVTGKSWLTSAAF